MLRLQAFQAFANSADQGVGLLAAEALVALAVRPTWKHDCKRERRAGALGGTEESNDARGPRVD